MKIFYMSIGRIAGFSNACPELFEDIMAIDAAVGRVLIPWEFAKAKIDQILTDRKTKFRKPVWNVFEFCFTIDMDTIRPQHLRNCMDWEVATFQQAEKSEPFYHYPVTTIPKTQQERHTLMMTWLRKSASLQKPKFSLDRGFDIL